MFPLLSVSIYMYAPIKFAYFYGRLGRQCQYEGQVCPRGIIGPSVTVPAVSSWIDLPKTYPLSTASSFDTSDIFKLSIHVAVTENLSRVVTDLTSLRKVATSFFNSVHLWFPIVLESSYYERLPTVFSNPCAEYSLLNLSLALITTIPPEDETWDSLTSTYMLVKSSIAVVEAANIHCLEVVQARLLVSLFEAGHGIEPAAYISIAATARAAAAIKLDQNNDDGLEEDASPHGEYSEGACVWWGIVMLDR